MSVVGRLRGGRRGCWGGWTAECGLRATTPWGGQPGGGGNDKTWFACNDPMRGGRAGWSSAGGLRRGRRSWRGSWTAECSFRATTLCAGANPMSARIRAWSRKTLLVPVREGGGVGCSVPPKVLRAPTPPPSPLPQGEGEFDAPLPAYPDAYGANPAGWGRWTTKRSFRATTLCAGRGLFSSALPGPCRDGWRFRRAPARRT